MSHATIGVGSRRCWILVGLTGQERDRVEGCSRSMRQRLHIARELLHDQQLVFLDESTIGVDSVGARELRLTVASLAKQGKRSFLRTRGRRRTLERRFTMGNTKTEAIRALKRKLSDVVYRSLLADAEATSLASLGEAA